MSDLTKPFIGYPQAPRPKGPVKTYEDTWLDSFLKGVMGEDPSGSVLEDNRQSKVDANRVGRVATVLGDLAIIPQALGAVAKVPAVAGAIQKIVGPTTALKVPPALAKSQQGAITVGGPKDLYASHAFRPEKAPDIARSGFLDAPSIGISSREANDYAPHNPQFIFRPGLLDSNKQVGTLINRDGYFHNPTSQLWPGGPASNETLQESLQHLLAKNKKYYGLDDLRLGQGIPSAGQGLAIAASPAFKSFREFEKSPLGAGALRTSKRSRDASWDKLNQELKDVHRVYGPDDLEQQFLRKPASERTPAEQWMWDVASRQPSAMAEFKVLQQLPLTPADAAVFVPNINHSTLRNLTDLRDAGFQFFTKGNFERGVSPALARMNEGLGQFAIPGSDETFKKLPGVASSTGELRVPKKLVEDMPKYDREAWLDFLNPRAGSSPPVSKARFVPEPLVPMTPAEAAAEKALLASPATDPTHPNWLAQFPDAETAAEAVLHQLKEGKLTKEQYFKLSDLVDERWPM